MTNEILESAFPVGPITYPDRSTTTYLGMTLRDYFAAKAMQSLLLADLNTIYPDALVSNASGEVSVSLTAYSLADAMLEARK